MKRFSKILAIVMVTALLMTIAALSGTAATTYTGVAGPSDVTFKKYMVINDGANVPAVTISFDIVPGTAISADSTHVAVLAGPAGATVGTATFRPNDTTTGTVEAGDNLTLTNGQVYTKQTVTIDLSHVTFTEPGVYRYNLTERNPGVTGLQWDNTTKYLDVYVTHDSTSGNLVVSSTVLHDTIAAPTRNATSGSADPDGDAAQNKLSDKIDGIRNEYPTKSLVFSKDVDGNQASRDKYFEFTVTIGGSNPGDVLTVDVTSDADSSINANPNAATTVISENKTQPTTLTVGDGGSVTQIFYLQHGQSIKIMGMREGATYSVVEREEDYTPSVAVTGDNGASGVDESVKEATNNGVSGTFDSTQDQEDGDVITAAFTNTKQGVIPTGVLLTIAPFAVGILLFGALAFFLISKRRREAY